MSVRRVDADLNESFFEWMHVTSFKVSSIEELIKGWKFLQLTGSIYFVLKIEDIHNAGISMRGSFIESTIVANTAFDAT